MSVISIYRFLQTADQKGSDIPLLPVKKGLAGIGSEHGQPVLECPVFHSEDISGHTRAGHCRSPSASALLCQKVRIPDISDR